jgi:hypothetical protein
MLGHVEGRKEASEARENGTNNRLNSHSITTTIRMGKNVGSLSRTFTLLEKVALRSRQPLNPQLP